MSGSVRTYGDLEKFVSSVLGESSSTFQLISEYVSKHPLDRQRDLLDLSVDGERLQFFRNRAVGNLLGESFTVLKKDPDKFAEVVSFVFPGSGAPLIDPLAPLELFKRVAVPSRGGDGDLSVGFAVVPKAEPGAHRASALELTTRSGRAYPPLESRMHAIRCMLASDPSLFAARRIDAGRALFQPIGRLHLCDGGLRSFKSGKGVDGRTDPSASVPDPSRGVLAWVFSRILPPLGKGVMSLLTGLTPFASKGMASGVWDVGLQSLVVEYLKSDAVTDIVVNVGSGASATVLTLTAEEIKSGPYLANFIAAGKGRELGGRLDESVTVGRGVSTVREDPRPSSPAVNPPSKSTSVRL